jgi:hypothetical protein
MIVGFILLLTGVIYQWFKDLELGAYTDVIHQLEGWNYYILVIGIIIFFFGVYYLYSFLKNKKFVLAEIKTKKRSEFVKMHNELKKVVKHLPSKYEKMLEDKEMELRMK